VSEGEMIEPGTPVEVTRVDGNRIVVRQATHINQEE
jgi:membrane protein implicated in regulation of membrane protease activity